jgi:hypothetical protein
MQSSKTQGKKSMMSISMVDTTTMKHTVNHLIVDTHNVTSATDGFFNIYIPT